MSLSFLKNGINSSDPRGVLSSIKQMLYMKMPYGQKRNNQMSLFRYGGQHSRKGGSPLLEMLTLITWSQSHIRSGFTVSYVTSRARCWLTAHSNLDYEGLCRTKLVKEQDLIWSTLEDDKIHDLQSTLFGIWKFVSLNKYSPIQGVSEIRHYSVQPHIAEALGDKNDLARWQSRCLQRTLTTFTGSLNFWPSLSPAFLQ